MTMETLEKNVINIWGEKGKTWLKNLPAIIAELSAHWCLNKVISIDNMSYNYVALAIQNNDHPVVLKISCDKQLIENEYRALKHFDGIGSIRLIEVNTKLNALLLEQAVPGYLLKKYHPKNIEETIKIYSGVIKVLASRPTPFEKYTHVHKWCLAIDRIYDKRINIMYIQKAKELRDFLLYSAEKEYLCHGDLHLENIVQQQNIWLSIDPKGIVGEMAFEAAAFDLIDKKEWTEPRAIQNKIVNRVSLLANTLNIDKERLLAWFFLRSIISAQWFVEDNGDPDEMMNLVSNLYPLFKKMTS